MTRKLPAALLAALSICVGTTNADPNGKIKFYGNVLLINDAGYYTFPDPLFLNYFNQLTSQDDLCEYHIQTGIDAFDWRNFDAMYHWCKSHNVYFRFHALWYTVVTPGFLHSLTHADKLTAFTNWVRAIGQRYPQIDYINVCNEPIHAGGGIMESPLGGAGSTGWDWLIKMLQLCRQYCPNAKLGINEFDVEYLGATFQSQYVRLVQLLKAKGLLDWVGFESYFLEHVSDANIKGALDQMGQTGVPIYITEFSLSYADQKQKLARWRDLLSLFVSHPSVYGVTGPWSYRWSDQWIQNTYILDDSVNPAAETPTLTWLKSYIPTVLSASAARPGLAPAPTPAPAVFVQINAATPQNPQATVSVAFPRPNTAGDLGVVVVGWNDSASHVKSVMDSAGNSYQLAGTVYVDGVAGQALYYGFFNKSTSNTVTVSFNQPANYPDIRVAEYSGAGQLDGIVSKTGNSQQSAAGPIFAHSQDLLIAANLVQTASQSAAGGFVSRLITNPDGDILEDALSVRPGPYNAAAALTTNSTGPWIMQVAAFRLTR